MLQSCSNILPPDFQTSELNGDDSEFKALKAQEKIIEPKTEAEALPSITESPSVDSKQDCCQRSTMDLQV